METLFGTEAAEAKGGTITCALPNPPAGPEDVPAAHLYRFTLEGNPHKFYLKLRYAPSTLERPCPSPSSLSALCPPHLLSLTLALLHVTGCRPHLEEFLMGVKDLFELHIYTMGSRSYARKVWERLSLVVTCVCWVVPCRVVVCAPVF